jgi:hypothetical protein
MSSNSQMRPRRCHVQRGDHEAAVRAAREALGEPAVTSVTTELPTFFPHRRPSIRRPMRRLDLTNIARADLRSIRRYSQRPGGPTAPVELFSERD